MSRGGILCYGDSLTGGRGVSYVDRLRTRLEPGIEIRSRAIPGATAADLERLWVGDGPEPALLIVTVGTNEVLMAFSPRSLKWVRRFRRRPVVVAGAEIAATLTRWLVPVRTRTEVALCGVAVAGAARHPRLAERLAEVNGALRAAAAEIRGVFVETDRALQDRMRAPTGAVPFSRLRDSVRWRLEKRLPPLAREPAPDAVTFDGVHLTARGAELFAAAVHSTVAFLLPIK